MPTTRCARASAHRARRTAAPPCGAAGRRSYAGRRHRAWVGALPALQRSPSRANLAPPCRSSKPAMPAETKLFLCLKDNYGVLLHDPATGATAAIDAPEVAPIEKALAATGWKLTDILVTHHHGDHTAGIAALKDKHHCRVVAPRNEASKIANIDETV